MKKLLCMLYGLLSITAISHVAASSWSATLLVNTEAFQIIDEGDGASNVVIQFGDVLNKTITFNRSLTQFEFNDDISVQGNVMATGTLSGQRLVIANSANCSVLQTSSTGAVSCGAALSQAVGDARYVNAIGDTMTGALIISNGAGLSASGTITTDANITINADQGATDAILTFGNNITNETLAFNSTASRFTFSDDVYIADNLFGSGSATFANSLTVDTNLIFGDSATNRLGVGTITPNSTLTVSGSIATNIKIKTTSYTLDETDSVILADATSAAITMTLPTAVGITGREYTIKKTDASLANTVTVATTASQTIDGLANYILKDRGSILVLQSNGTNWIIIEEKNFDILAHKARGATLNRWYSSNNNTSYNSSATTYTMVANTLRTTPLVVSKTTTFDQMAISVTTLAAGSSCRVGIYNDNGNLYPSSLVLDAGIQATATVGVKTFVTGLPVTLQPGLYWFVHNCNGAPIIRGINSIGIMTPLGFDSTFALNNGIGWTIASAFAAFPANFPAGAAVLPAAATTGGNAGIFIRASQ